MQAGILLKAALSREITGPAYRPAPPVRRQPVPPAARVGHDSQVRRFRQIRRVKNRSTVEQVGYLLHPHYASPVEQSIIVEVFTGQSACVRLCCRHALMELAWFDHDNGLVAGKPAGSTHKLLGISQRGPQRLLVNKDSPGFRVHAEIVDKVPEINVQHVAQETKRTKPMFRPTAQSSTAVPRAPLWDREGHSAGFGAFPSEGSIQVGRGANNAETIGAD